jgi:hypothetical protein
MPMKDGKPIPYREGGVDFDDELTTETGGATITEALSISMDPEASEYDKAWSKNILKNATEEQKSAAREQLNVPDGMNMGGVVDELGYMGGGVSYSDRGPIKYSKGGAVKGKKFAGNF